MRIVNGEAIKERGVTNLYTVPPVPHLPTWEVRMDVPGLLWWPRWSGLAVCAVNASELALADFRAKWGGIHVRVTSVCEVRS